MAKFVDYSSDDFSVEETLSLRLQDGSILGKSEDGKMVDLKISSDESYMDEDKYIVVSVPTEQVTEYPTGWCDVNLGTANTKYGDKTAEEIYGYGWAYEQGLLADVTCFPNIGFGDYKDETKFATISEDDVKLPYPGYFGPVGDELILSKDQVSFEHGGCPGDVCNISLPLAIDGEIYQGKLRLTAESVSKSESNPDTYCVDFPMHPRIDVAIGKDDMGREKVITGVLSSNVPVMAHDAKLLQAERAQSRQAGNEFTNVTSSKLDNQDIEL